VPGQRLEALDAGGGDLRRINTLQQALELCDELDPAGCGPLGVVVDLRCTDAANRQAVRGDNGRSLGFCRIHP
jgi:hypothetical protein